MERENVYKTECAICHQIDRHSKECKLLDITNTFIKKKKNNIIYDKNGEPKGIVLPTKKKDCKDKIDEAFVGIFSRFN